MQPTRPVLALALGAAFACAACGGGGGTSATTTTTTTATGNAAHGETVFAQSCAACHGEHGSGGTAPKLAGLGITLEDAKKKIDEGASGMPAGLVAGQDEADVLAYLQTILGS